MIKKTSLIIFSLSLFFIFFSFVPTIYEYSIKDNVPANRYFLLEHNYNFDYNFYLSRIRQGIEGRWLVTEKYYNQPHQASLFQIVYLYIGKFGNLFGLSVPLIYQLSRFSFGLSLLLLIAKYGSLFFKGRQLILFFILAATASSFPVLVKVGNFYRFGNYMGWWSVIDPLSRLTIMPHILIGQGLLVYLIFKFNDSVNVSLKKAVLLGVVGLIAGIIFPPTVIVVYMYLIILGIIQLLDNLSLKIQLNEKKKKLMNFMLRYAARNILFLVLTLPSFIYLSNAFKVQPWKALSVFDIEHRFIMPYKDYALALGPVLELGILGLVFVFIKGKKSYYSPVAWILAILFLFVIFEKVPEQSPLRFTEGLVQVPLAVLTTYFLSLLWQKLMLRVPVGFLTGGIVTTGLLMMLSLVFWLTDQAYAKRFGTWPVPLGAQLAYPVKEFMDGIFYLKDNTEKSEVVLGYISTGNYIPAYAGNYVYIGHANTPHEDKKEIIAARFFKTEMTTSEASDFLKKERISLIFFGPQERELSSISDLKEKYDFLKPIYNNAKVIIYKTN